MADEFRADCEDLIDLSKLIGRTSDDVEESAKKIRNLDTPKDTFGRGEEAWGSAPYETLRWRFEELQEDIAETVDEVAEALRAVAENYLRVDEEIS